MRPLARFAIIPPFVLTALEDWTQHLALVEICVNVHATKRDKSPPGKELAMDKDQTNVNKAMDMSAHEETYKKFTGFVLFGIITFAIILASLAIFLT